MSNRQSLPKSADTVIVGAGIVGCSAAYHLAELGRNDVVVLDQGPIFDTGGSTSHTPGLSLVSAESKTLGKFAQESIQLYSRLDLNGEQVFDATGNLEVAMTERRREHFERRVAQDRAFGYEGTETLSSEEAAEKLEYLNPDAIKGAYWNPRGGATRNDLPREALGRQAQDQGVSFHSRTQVIDVKVVDEEVKAIETDRGPIECENLLVAANIWAPILGKMAGVDIPLIAGEHQYAVTDPLNSFETDPKTKEFGNNVSIPVLRDQDNYLYFRQEGNALGIGSYQHEANLVEATDLATQNESDAPAIHEFTQTDFESVWKSATSLLPVLKNADIDYGMNGMFAFSPDLAPIMGEAPQVDGFWVTAALWVTQAGGAGKTIAEWIVEGRPSLDVHACDIARFQPHAGSREFVKARAREEYGEHYDVNHPREPYESARGLRRSPFHSHQEALDATFFESAGWERPQWFDSNEALLEKYDVPDRSGWEAEHWSPIAGAEHYAVRDSVGLFDLSNITSVEISGADALAFAQRVFTNDIDVDIGMTTYTTMLDKRGGIVGDMTVTRLGTNRFFVTANAGEAGTEQVVWLNRQKPNDADVSIIDRTSGMSGIGVWGPDAQKLLEPLIETDLSAGAFPYFSAEETYAGSVPVTALRVSYVGELGWELHTPSEYGAQLWEILWEVGQEYNVVPMGDEALDSMRLEKGYRLYGADIHSEHTPLEAGLEFAVDFGTDFLGKDALLNQRESDIEEHLCCLTLDDSEEVVMSSMPIYNNKDLLGYVTSANYGYSVNAGVAYGYLPTDYVDSGTSVEIRYGDKWINATVREEPLFDPTGDHLNR